MTLSATGAGDLRPNPHQAGERQDMSDPAIGVMLTIDAGWPKSGRLTPGGAQPKLNGDVRIACADHPAY